MKNIRTDQDGQPRCWNCGGRAFAPQRTMRSKLTLGVASVLTKQKMRCVRCGEYNDVGSAEPYTGPKSRKYKQEWQAEQAAIEARSTEG